MNRSREFFGSSKYRFTELYQNKLSSAKRVKLYLMPQSKE